MARWPEWHLDEGEAHLSKAIETGEHCWRPVVAATGGDLEWWLVSATRLYMLAVHAMGILHKSIISLASVRRIYGEFLFSGDRQMANDIWIGQPTTKPTTATVRSGMAYYVDSPADRFVEAIEEEPKPYVRMVLATRALRHDPGCIEAHLEMAAYLDDNDARMAHLGKAIETGEHLWQPVAAAEGGDLDWWLVSATRPYMRAIHAMGVLHKENGKTEEARKCFEQLLDMNPNDNQRIRKLVAELNQVPVFNM